MRKNSVYSLHPGYAMEASYEKLLKERTGRTIDDWVAIVKKSGPKDENGRRAWLKEQGLTTNYAHWVVERASGNDSSSYDPDAFVEQLFSGKKAGLRPIYDRLLGMAFELGKDVKVSPGKTIVPFYRNHVFGQVKPTTNTRIDLGFALGAMKAEGRLISTGGFEKKDRITHRIPIEGLDEIDAEVKKWLKRAYTLDA